MSEPVVSVKPVVLPDSDLRVRISAPARGRDLPVVVFSHGFGSSLDGYGPLTDHWAAHGFVVVQPTHPDSRTTPEPYTPQVWRERVAQVRRVLDELAFLETVVPGLAGRVDRDRVAAAGHSFGGQTAGTLLGLRVADEDLSDKRVAAGVLLATAGRGGADLSPFAAEHFPFMNPDFTHMTTPALVVAGDKDDSPLTVRGPDWMADPYHLSPGPKSLLTVFGAEHSLGGIPGYEAKETTDENPAAVAMIQQVTTAYLRHALGSDNNTDDTDWVNLPQNPLGQLESRH
jgi:predicted dienelactone hydrolase